MRRIIDFSTLFSRSFLAVSAVLALSLHGCAILKKPVPVKPPAPQPVLQETIERNDFPIAKDDDVVGRPASLRLVKGDTLPDVARHFSLGISEVCAANPAVDTWLPEPDERIVLPLSHILPDCPRKGIVINLAAMRLFQFRGDAGSPEVSTYPVGIGTTERPSPTGPMYVRSKTFRPTWVVPASIAEDHRKKGDILPARVPPGPENPLGEYALYLSKPSYLIHGTNKPYSIGLNATNGCIRLYPEDVKRLYASTPVNTPVRILNQPYLVGRHNGTVYLEAHAPLGGSEAAEMEKTFAKLRSIEKKSGRKIDWARVEEVFAKARGIPVPVSEAGQGSEKGIAEAVELRHPEKLYGRPEVPEMRMGAWYVSAAVVPDRVEAMRLAAIINHQGPQIPARVLPRSSGYRVITGPFNDLNEARETVKRLRFDLEIEGILVEPAGK